MLLLSYGCLHSFEWPLLFDWPIGCVSKRAYYNFKYFVMYLLNNFQVAFFWCAAYLDTVCSNGFDYFIEILFGTCDPDIVLKNQYNFFNCNLLFFLIMRIFRISPYYLNAYLNYMVSILLNYFLECEYNELGRQ